MATLTVPNAPTPRLQLALTAQGAGTDVALMRGDAQGNVYLAGVSGVRRFATLSGAQTTLPTSGTLADVGTPFTFWLGVN